MLEYNHIHGKRICKQSTIILNPIKPVRAIDSQSISFPLTGFFGYFCLIGEVMATKRMISSSLPKSKKMRRLKDDTTRLLFYMLCVSCDDDGKMDGEPEDIRADLFGGRDEIKIQDVDKMLTDLAQTGLIVFYQDKKTGEKYINIPNWKEFNKIPKDRYKPSKIPCYSKDLHNMLTECKHDVNKMLHRVVKNRIDKNRIDSLSGTPDQIDYKKIIDDLNSKAGTSYRHTTEAVRKLIRARIKEGATLEEFFKVHTNMVDAWKDTEQAPYIRPQTLYTGKFDSYLNYIKPVKKIKDSEWV